MISEKADWIAPREELGELCPVFQRTFSLERDSLDGTLEITALGVYESYLDGERVGQFLLAPGWTSYKSRLQVQSYSLEGLRAGEHTLTVTVAPGWYRGRIGWSEEISRRPECALPPALLLELRLKTADGEVRVVSDESFQAGEGPLRLCELYDGVRYDARVTPQLKPVRLCPELREVRRTLIPQQGEEVRAQERLRPVRLFTTPRGERVLDFGQEITGAVRLTLTAGAGDRVRLSHGEMLDRDGNFYNANYRSAKALLEYTCREGEQSYLPTLTFYGFRYVRIDEFPGEPDLKHFEAVVFHSQMRRTGWLECGHELLNRLLLNTVWGQKGNYLDIPTDCPQRDERLGWTGDAQVFTRAASYYFDVERFFKKWLADLAADQGPDGLVPKVVPDVLHDPWSGAAWGDAAVITPWELYVTYGDPDILRRQYPSMRSWVDYITAHTTTPGLWTGGEHHGDWLGLDAPSGSYMGSSDRDLIASAYYAHDLELLCRAGEVLGEDVAAYRALRGRAAAAFRAAYGDRLLTQTEYALALHFGLSADPRRDAAALAEKVRACGHLETGFVGTPYLLHALSDNGFGELAYDLLLREEYPSWLYAVKRGATTIWEHWDGVMEDGDFWSTDMNSFNHYSYGAVADWVFECAAGIKRMEDAPGFARLRVEPHPDARLGHLAARLHTRRGTVRVLWRVEPGGVRYELETPVDAEVKLPDGRHFHVGPGVWMF